MSQSDYLLANNVDYVKNGKVPEVALAGPRFFSPEVQREDTPRYAVVTCMDPRIDPIRALGLDRAAIIRNGGGIARDALRSLIIWQELGRGKEIAVVHHTDCGALRIHTEEILKGPKNIPADVHFNEFSDLEESVREDVAWLKERVLDGALLEGTNVAGYLLDNETGKLRVID